jgi:hypothetical protein
MNERRKEGKTYEGRQEGRKGMKGMNEGRKEGTYRGAEGRC